MRRRLIRTRVYLMAVVLLIAAGLLLIEPQTESVASPPQGKGGAIKPAPTATSSRKKANPPEGKKPKSTASKSSEPSTTAKSKAEQPAITISALQSLSNYDSSLRDNIYTIVMPRVTVRALSVRSGSVLLQNGSRGTEFEDFQLQQRGNDAFVSFRLQPGAYARISRRTLERREKLEIFILSQPGNVLSNPINSNLNANIGTGTATNSNNSNSNASPILPGTRRTPSITDQTEVSKTLPFEWPPRYENPDPELLLPSDLEKSRQRQSESLKPASTTGTFSEISAKRRVFVKSVQIGAEDKIITRLREYGGFEVVKIATDAELAIHYDPFGFDQPSASGWKRVSGGSVTVTIRDPSQHVPRIIWSHRDTDGGWFKRDDALDKLMKRFIKELKKLRGEK